MMSVWKASSKSPITRSFASSRSSSSVHPLVFLARGACGGCASFLTRASSFEPGSGARPWRAAGLAAAGAAGLSAGGRSAAVSRNSSRRGPPANRWPSRVSFALRAAFLESNVMYHPSASAKACHGPHDRQRPNMSGAAAEWVLTRSIPYLPKCRCSSSLLGTAFEPFRSGRSCWNETFSMKR